MYEYYRGHAGDTGDMALVYMYTATDQGFGMGVGAFIIIIFMSVSK